MIITTILLEWLWKAWAWIKARKVLVIAVVLGIVVLLLLLTGGDDKPEIRIRETQEETEALQKKVDERIGSDFNAIDRKREEDDRKVREASNKTPPKKNVNARELEEMLRK